jgi:hypothetical protein
MKIFIVWLVGFGLCFGWFERNADRERARANSKTAVLTVETLFFAAVWPLTLLFAAGYFVAALFTEAPHEE